MSAHAAGSFADRLHIRRFDNAAYFAGPLFEESFRSAFPTPPDGAGWAQYVAFYRWDDGGGDRTADGQYFIGGEPGA